MSDFIKEEANIMILEKKTFGLFKKGQAENQRFWSRLGIKPSFDGLKVLDVGCGLGSLCCDIASKGAKKIIGIDIDQQSINFARKNLVVNYSQFKNIIEFRCCEVSMLTKIDFDIIVSKDSFEHILNLEVVLAEMSKRLKWGGKMYIGFGPLYNSPYGDHGWTKSLVPWGHLIFPERFLIKRLNRIGKRVVKDIYELGLNKLSLKEYKRIFYNSGLRVSTFLVNRSDNPISKLFSLIRQIPFLEEYFSHNLYCILEKK